MFMCNEPNALKFYMQLQRFVLHYSNEHFRNEAFCHKNNVLLIIFS